MYGFGSIRHRETAEARLDRLNNGFRAVSLDIDRSSASKQRSGSIVRQMVACSLMASLVSVASVVLYAEFRDHKWSLVTMLRHMAAAPSCSTALAVGLAPARRGEPGYYRRHDRDQDGIACEPWSRY